MRYIVRSACLLGYPELVQQLGGNPAALLDMTGLLPAVLHDPDLYVPYVLVADLFRLTAQHCDAPDFGVRLAGEQGLEVVGALAPLLCLQPTLGEAFELLQKNLGFHARGIGISARIEDSCITLDLQLEFEQQTDCTLLAERSLALLAQVIAQLHGTALVPDKVILRSQRPPDIRAHRRVFGRTPVFGQARNQLRYPLELTGLPVRVNAALRERLNVKWRSDWQQRQPVTLREQIERAINALLPTGDCSLERVAGMIDLHPRVLQHRLSQNGLSFGLILQQVREKLAREYLAHSDISLTALAMNLGYGELAVFSRAFKQWTGSSPSQWRVIFAG